MLFTRLMSAVAGSGTSTTARAQSRDRFVTWLIWPFGMITTSPSTVRRLVTRSVTSSTVPVTPVVAPEVRDADEVAEPVLALGDDEEAGEDVLDDALRAEAERDAGDGGRRDQAGDRHAEPFQHQHAGDAVDQHQRRST